MNMKRRSDFPTSARNKWLKTGLLEDTPGLHRSADRTKSRKDFKESDPVEEQTQPYRLATARLPITVLRSTWSIGKNRHLDEQHALNLCNIFRSGSLDRKARENRLRVLCSKTAVERMLDHLNRRDALEGDDDAASASREVLSFADWHSVNGDVTVELMAGQHRARALELYIQQTGAGDEEAWWTCDFYDRGL